MQTLRLIPRGNVDVTKDYGINTVEFESGSKQYQRKWITPRITYTFNTENSKAQKRYLEAFAEAHFGNYEPFYWMYEGRKIAVRFAESSLKFTEIRGYGGEGVVGYRAQISLVVCKESELKGFNTNDTGEFDAGDFAEDESGEIIWDGGDLGDL